MTVFSILPFAAGFLGLIVGLASLFRKKRSLAVWCFFAGMSVLGIDSILTGLSLQTTELLDELRFLTLGLIVNSFVPAAWLVFSLTYSRGDSRESLARWRMPLAIVVLLPIALSVFFQNQLVDFASGSDGAQLRFSAIAKAVNVLLLVALVWILMNLEQTFRSAVGTMRWQIKFVVLALVVMFGARLYVRSQTILFSAYDVHWSGIESSALLIGCVFLLVGYARTGFAEIDVYPSRAVLKSSLTVLIVGSYLFIVGILARVVKYFGGAEGFQFQAFVVLLGMAGLALLLLSDRLRQRIHEFVGRHFARAQHDSVRIWADLSRRLSKVTDQASLCAACARLVSETFEVLSVTIWVLDDEKEQLIPAASTTPRPVERTAGNPSDTALSAVVAGLRIWSSPFDLESVNEPWAGELRKLNPAAFPNGGHRWCVPLRAGEQTLGTLVLADRVNGAAYRAETLQLLQCIADQMASVLVKFRLADEVARAREMEAFRTMSAFFVHDLKNAAASLNLMLKNLPVHFDDPAFRADALRGIGNAARRIDKMIAGLTALRQRPASDPVEADLNQLITEALQGLNGMAHVDLTKELQPLPKIRVDREQIRSVVTNLVLNARDALGPGGHIQVQTNHLGNSVVLKVADNGCGMSPAFLNESLFRPFQSTKKEGLGIGMFQCRMVVEEHGGSIRVESEAGKGSTFWVSLPVKD